MKKFVICILVFLLLTLFLNGVTSYIFNMGFLYCDNSGACVVKQPLIYYIFRIASYVIPAFISFMIWKQSKGSKTLAKRTVS
jgi:hypothetical protein